MKKLLLLIAVCIPFLLDGQLPDALKWTKYELVFTGSVGYNNPLQDLKSMEVTFTSPSGRIKTINGFWDGGMIWKARFMPDEPGTWRFVTKCSDPKNTGLDGKSGSFRCIQNNIKKDIYQNGPIINPEGTYHLAHATGKPFFWLACTAWNGALLSTEEEWDYYLQNRVGNNYSVIQLVTTQWRGCERNKEGLVAFEGSGKISVNPEFFRRIDSKIDRVNEYGLVAMPVILWALQNGNGREFSPGYYLPDDQAILLAKYIVARYGGNHVVWSLGGDGVYTGTYEQRWKTIGRAVFNGRSQGIVAQHPCGISWIGEVYRDEPWLDIVGYQSSHSNARPTVDWITKGPMSQMWHRLPARPMINLEPNYEQHQGRFSDRDVRNASWWSILATPVAGVTYGANAIWPWLEKGQKAANHSGSESQYSWKESLDFPGSVQMGYLAEFMKKLKWWEIFPAQELLVEQPGDSTYNHFISVARSTDNSLIIAYVPVKHALKIRKPAEGKYKVTWFDPVKNRYTDGTSSDDGLVISVEPTSNQDMVLMLRAEK